jgi:dTDP-4-amino-4,6-dideoxygalactose transaminase
MTPTPPSPVHPIPFTDIAAMTREVRTEIDAAVARVLDSGRFIGGATVERFEREWADYCGTAHAIALANGTDAIHLTLRGLGIGPGDEVVVPTNTFVATAEAVVLAGATPRFADVDPGTLLLTAETLQAALTPRSRAVLVVHLYGQVADMDAIGQVAARSGLLVLEDAAQAHGATWRGRPAGSFGQAGCFSFYPGKNLGAAGDAGAVVTDDPLLDQRLRSLRDHGRADGSHYDHQTIGTNSRMDALQAGILSAKLARLPAWTEARLALAHTYRDQLNGGPVQLVEEHPDARSAHHLLVARVPERERVRRQLREAGIDTGLHYPTPCHLLAPYRRYASGPLPVAETAAEQIVSLPLFPHMTGEQVSRVCTELLRSVPAEEGPRVA